MSNHNENATPANPTMEWVMQRIEQVIGNTEYIKQAFTSFEATMTAAAGEFYEGDIGKVSQTFSDAIKSRETTNQQTLKLLEKMYEDLKPPKPGEQRMSEADRLTKIAEIVDKAGPGVDLDFLKAVLK